MQRDQTLPIACSLTASDMHRRLTEIGALGADALVESRRHGAHAELRFADGAGIRARVDAIVAAESRCCAFLRMQTSREPDTIVLTIDAPDDAEPVLAEFVDAFGRDTVSA